MEQLNNQHDFNDQLDTREGSGQFRNLKKTPHVSNSKFCTFYLNYGFCKFGQNCKFLHRRRYYSSNKPAQRKSEYLKRDALTLPQKERKNTEVTSREYYSNRTTTHKNLQKQTCRYYKAGQCEKGENCLYNHNIDSDNFKTDVTVPQNKKGNLNSVSNVGTSKKKSIPICHYFRRGSCQKGDQCKYYHNPKYQQEHINPSSNANENSLADHQTNSNKEVFDEKNTEHDSVTFPQSDTINSENAANLVPSSSGPLHNHENSDTLPESKNLKSNESHNAVSNDLVKIRIQIPQNSRIFNLTTLPEDGLCQLRNTEITQLKKRFPKLKENGSSFTFDFEPTDPDWVCDITVVSHMNYVPGVLLRHLNQSICDWLIEKHNDAIEKNQVILLFRPFLKWFDKNLEELFNCGLKKVTEVEEANYNGNESVLAEHHPPLSSEIKSENDLSEHESSADILDAQTNSEKEENHSPIRQKIEPTSLNNLQSHGSKVIFTGLELIEGVAALSCKKLAVAVHCGRCKTSCNKILIPNKNTPMLCSKCSKNMECKFNPSILHQFSSVLGTMYLMDCQAVDVNLVECAFLIDCLSCSKQVPVDGLHYGQKQKLWCKFCNQKLILGIESVKFQASAATAVTASNKTVAVKKVTKKKDPVIKEGCPLPDYGACKHYKKSYRWLRFPCCGRLYPCDLCHDEKEDDHDMKYASRMVCGFCSKEQPYSKEKPCFGCSANMTKKSGSYWEGGQGCRNSVTMSR
ncbi:unnamed protein product [Larinioides sclopetarius]|uniref:Nucleoporin NUP42 n=1 Tax=Larinioides sclopetarius TaxID=280406 RepID=A0AAV1Z1E4_9ARAC